jgi:hypothetical protein
MQLYTYSNKRLASISLIFIETKYCFYIPFFLRFIGIVNFNLIRKCDTVSKIIQLLETLD